METFVFIPSQRSEKTFPRVENIFAILVGRFFKPLTILSKILENAPFKIFPNLETFVFIPCQRLEKTFPRVENIFANLLPSPPNQSTKVPKISFILSKLLIILSYIFTVSSQLFPMFWKKLPILLKTLPIKDSLLNQLPIFENILPVDFIKPPTKEIINLGIFKNNNLNACFILSKNKEIYLLIKTFKLLIKSETEETFRNTSKKLINAVFMLSIILAKGSKIFAMVFVSIKPRSRPDITEEAAEITLSPREATCPTILSALNHPVNASNTLITAAIIWPTTGITFITFTNIPKNLIIGTMNFLSLLNFPITPITTFPPSEKTSKILEIDFEKSVITELPVIFPNIPPILSNSFTIDKIVLIGFVSISTIFLGILSNILTTFWKPLKNTSNIFSKGFINLPIIGILPEKDKRLLTPFIITPRVFKNHVTLVIRVTTPTVTNKNNIFICLLFAILTTLSKIASCQILSL